MRIVVIGATGHIGTYLVPRLVAAGHEVVAVSRGRRAPYREDPAWSGVERVVLDRADAGFAAAIAALRPEAVVDLICFTVDEGRPLVEALRGRIAQFVHCGTIWVYGPTVTAPADEEHPRRPLGDYGRNKAALEAYLLDLARRGDFPAAIFHPGHIVGPGWRIINPAGHCDPAVFADLAAGRRVTLPDLGMGLLHHVHADDLALLCAAMLERPERAIGEAFNATSPAALTMRGYAEAVAGWFGRRAELAFAPLAAWRTGQDPEQAAITEEHLRHNPCAAIAKARAALDYAPRSSLEAVRDCLDWLPTR